MDIKLCSITKQYDKNIVFQDLTITFLEGQINCLMGNSGIGKTTIMNLLLGITKPDSGNILGVNGKRFAAVFQEDRLIEHWDAIHNIKLVCAKQISQKLIEEEFRKVCLEEYKDKPVIDLSGGMRRRVAIVRAMLAPSDIIILDEPFKGLDEELKRKVIHYIKDKTKGKTVIIVTHDKEDVVSLGGKRINLN